VDIPSDFYNEKLNEENINVKARNFLVFQGDVTNLASKKPTELTQMFEEMSGSSALKNK
jgi:structural maintenance of chromosome 1